MTTSNPHETKHTPGPWVWGDGFGDLTNKYADCQLYGANEQVIIPIRVDHHDPIWDIDRHNRHGVLSEADRALISAAPDLLEACQDALDRMEKQWSDDNGGGPAFSRDDTAKLRAAIAKATK